MSLCIYTFIIAVKPDDLVMAGLDQARPDHLIERCNLQ